MPTEAPVYRASDVDFERWADEGVRLILWDYEATLGETGNPEPIAELAGCIPKARELGIPHHALTTNFHIQTQGDRQMVRAWQEHTEADLVLTPLQPNQAKPSPVMAYKALRHFKLLPEEAGVIGDKATADMRAGYFAGVQHRAWTRPFGDNRHIGDRVVRDPAERVLRVLAHLRHTPRLLDTVSTEAVSEELFDQDPSLREIIPGIPDGQDKIVGFGMADIELDEITLALIKTPAYRQALQDMSNLKQRFTEAPAAQMREFMHEHGRITADVLTYSRLALAAGLLAVNRRNSLSPEAKRRLSTALEVAALATDLFDGKAARAHKHGATAQGGVGDQTIDKVVEAVTDIFVLLPNEAIDELQIAITSGRNLGMTALRKPFRDRGMDTRSIMSGKVAAAVKGGAGIFGTALAHRYPVANRRLQLAATTLKVTSALHGPSVWIEDYERQQHLANNWQHLLEQSPGQ